MSRVVLYQDTALAPMPPITAPRGWFPAHEPTPPQPASIKLVAQLAQGANVLATTAGTSNSRTYQQPINPEVFATPFPAAQQQFLAVALRLLPSASTPQGFWGLQLEYAFAKPFPAAAQQFLFEPQTTIRTAATPQGWHPLEFDYKFAVPFLAAAQQFSGHVPEPPPTGIALAQSHEIVVIEQRTLYEQSFFPPKPIPQPANGWQAVRFDCAFTPRFPVTEQLWFGFDLKQLPTTTRPEGWRGNQFEYAFTKPFPAHLQHDHTIIYGVVKNAEPEGWRNYQFDIAFAVPFPAALQQFDATNRFDQIPPYLPPGAGRRYLPPTDYLPEPAYDVEQRKPIRPIWDRGGKVDPEKKPEPAPPSGPPPLPPMSVFGQSAPMSVMSLDGLPTFQEYVPRDAMATARQLQHALDESDAIAALRALGLLKDEDE